MNSVPYFDLVKSLLQHFDEYKKNNEKELELRDARIEYLEKEVIKQEELRKQIIQEREQTIQENKQAYEKLVRNLQQSVSIILHLLISAS